MALFFPRSALRAQKLLRAFLPDADAAWLEYEFWQVPVQSSRVASVLSRYLWVAVVFYIASLILLRLLFLKPAKKQHAEAKQTKERDRPSLTLMFWNCFTGLVALAAVDALLQDDVSFFAPGIFRLPSTYRPISRAVATLVPAGSLILFVDSFIVLALEKAGNVNLFTHVLSRVYPPLFLNFCMQAGLPSTHCLVSLYLGDVTFQRGIAVATTVLTLLGWEGPSDTTGSEASPAVAVGKTGERKGEEEKKKHTENEQGCVSKKAGVGVQSLAWMAALTDAVHPLLTVAVCLSSLYDPATNQLPGAASMVLACKWGIGIALLLSYFNVSVYIDRFHKKYRAYMSTFLSFSHVFAFVGVLLLLSHHKGWRIFFEVLGLYMVTGLGITCGAHRLWSHRSYKAALPWRIFMLLLNSIANQGSIYHWSRDHRVHHKHSDKAGDPYNSSRGFFYSHVGWLLLKKPTEVHIAGKDVDCSDLLEDPCVRIQRRLDPWWNQFFCFVLPGIYAYCHYNSFWLGFFCHGALRWCMCLHATWTVNSVAHFWGDRPYAPKTRPSESIFTSFVAVGEGWHNWHHLYPFDYAAAEGGVFQHYNPSKLVIDLGAKLGLVWSRRRATSAWQLACEKREDLLKAEEHKLLERMQVDKQIILLESIKQMLPAHLYRIHPCRNMVLLFRDLSFLVTLYFVAYRMAGIQHLLAVLSAPRAPFASASPLITVMCFVLLLVLSAALATAAGTLWFALFVHATEAASGLFSPWPVLNHSVALSLTTAMLVPYKPTRMGQPYEAPAIRPCLFDSCFRFLHLAGANCWQISFFLCVALFCGLSYTAFSLGYLKEVLIFYVCPYVVCNIWMAYYYRLLESGGPHDVTNEENAVNFKFASPLALQWMKQVHEERRGKGQGDRGGAFWRGIDSLHHHLPLKHLVQALSFGISRQGLREAASIIEQRLATLPDLTGDGTSEEEAATAAPSTPQSPTDFGDSLETRETEFAKCASC